MGLNRIETYSNYRDYLRDFYEDSKAKYKYFSYRYFCQKAGISSPVLFRDVVNGNRNLTNKTIPKFVKGLGLNEVEGKFFEALVRYGQSESIQEKTIFLEQMQNLIPTFKEDLVPEKYHVYYSKWYHIALRELACLYNWNGDYKLLGKKLVPSIKEKEAEDGIQLLLALGFLKKENGTFVQSAPHIHTGVQLNSMVIRDVNYQFSGLGSKAILTIPPEERDISSVTMGISEEAMELCKREIGEFKKRIKHIVSIDEHSNRVYQLNVQLFPLSRESKDGEK